MGTTEKKSAIAELVELGKGKGKLTTQEISTVIEELDFDMDQMDKLYESLEANSIEVVEDFVPEIGFDFPDLTQLQFIFMRPQDVYIIIQHFFCHPLPGIPGQNPGQPWRRRGSSPI